MNNHYGTIYCKECGLKEHGHHNFKRNWLDNGGGWGRMKLIGNCPKCKYPYAVLFHAYSMDEEDDIRYMNYYLSHILVDIIKDIESSK